MTEIIRWKGSIGGKEKKRWRIEEWINDGKKLLLKAIKKERIKLSNQGY